MSQADELLNTLAETTDNHSHPLTDDDSYFIINPVTRTITNGRNERNVLMQYDHGSEVYTFEVPRYIDGHDMMLCNKVLVHWNNIGSGPMQEIAESTELQNLRLNPNKIDTVICSWKITRNSTRYAGILSFLIQYKCVENGESTYEWHTDVYSNVEVRTGRNNSEDSVVKYTDVVEQLIARWESELFGAGDSVISNINATGEAQKAAVASKGAETLASIPDDYTTLYNTADDALRTRANAIVVTAEGEKIVVDNCSDDHLRSMNVYGRTTQMATTGKQLAWVNINVADDSYLGVVASATEDGNILLHGTAIGNLWNRLVSAELVAGKAYTLSCHKSIALSVWDVTADGSFTVKPAGQESITFTAPHTGGYSFCIENVNGTQFPYIKADIMLALGSAAQPWEPYSGGYASPHPNWQQALKSVTDPIIGIYGTNLLNVEEMELASNTSLTISPDKYTITVVGGSDKTYAYSHYDMPESLVHLLRGRTLRLSSDSVSKSLSNAYSPVQLNIKCADGTFQYPVNHDSKLYHEFFVPEDTVEIRFGIYTNNSANVLESDNTVVVKGVRLTLADRTAYEPYKDYQAFTLTRTLNGIKTTESGNYVDSDGNRWICDEVDFGRGVHIQRVGVMTFNSAYEYVGESSVDGSGIFYCGVMNYDVLSYTLAMMSDRFKFAGYDTTNAAAKARLSNGEFSYIRNPTAGARLYFAVSGVASKDEATTWLAGALPTVYYPLKTPVETPLTEMELFAATQAHGNRLVTTVLNSENAYMKITYNADTMRFLEQLPKVPDEQVSRLVNNWLTENFLPAEEVSL